MYIEMGDRIKENINTMNFMRDIILNDVIDMVPTVSFIQGIVEGHCRRTFWKVCREFEPGRSREASLEDLRRVKFSVCVKI